MSEQKSRIGKVTNFSDAEGPAEESVMGDEKGVPPSAGFATLTLDGVESYRLDKSDARYGVWSGVLRRWPAHELPVYVEAVGEEGLVEKLVTPDIKRVASVESEPREGRLKVVPHATPIFYYLGADHPNYDDLTRLLRRVAGTSEPVLFFIDPHSPLNDDRILDVRRAEGEVAADGAPTEGDADLSDGPVSELPDGSEAKLLEAPPPPPPALRPSVSEDEAQLLFDDLSVNYEIPFCYIRDCCKARAHKMCAIIRAAGVAVRKVWNYGSGTLATLDEALWTDTLSVQTPQGLLRWKFHTAPLIEVELAGGEVEQRVLDPATFDRPATVEEWKALQGDGGSRLRKRDARYYWFSPHDEPGGQDKGLKETEERLLAHAAKCV